MPMIALMERAAAEAKGKATVPPPASLPLSAPTETTAPAVPKQAQPNGRPKAKAATGKTKHTGNPILLASLDPRDCRQWKWRRSASRRTRALIRPVSHAEAGDIIAAYADACLMQAARVTALDAAKTILADCSEAVLDTYRLMLATPERPPSLRMIGKALGFSHEMARIHLATLAGHGLVATAKRKQARPVLPTFYLPVKTRRAIGTKHEHAREAQPCMT